MTREETSCYLDSRPSSSAGLMAPTPDISCSPIISPDLEDREAGEEEKSKEGETERKTSTSTPLGIFSSHHNLFYRISSKKTI